MRHLAVLAAVFAAALALAVLPATTARAATTPPISTISWDTSGLCLSATSHHAGAPAVLAQCDPGTAAQSWVITAAGKFRLLGTSRYLTLPGQGEGVVLGTWASSPAWVYVNHSLAASGMWLTWCSGSASMQPWGQVDYEPGCATWYVFTKVSGA